jgi:hypothetical protein
LQQWLNSSKTVIANVDINGDILNNGFLLYGSDTFITNATGASSTTLTTFTPKLTATTGNLMGGRYMVLTKYTAKSASFNFSVFLNTRTFVDGTITAQTGSIPLVGNGQGYPVSYFTDVRLSAGTHTILVDYASSNGTSATIDDVSVWLYRITQ